MTTNRFNLIDEPWIPIIGKGAVSLKQLFSSEYAEIGGNPIQKIALTKLLLAIAQSAHTPQDEEECQTLGPAGIATHCLAYLEKYRDCFWLYGEKPFLQMPGIKIAKTQPLSAVIPDVATGNTSLVFETQKEKTLTDAEKAVLIVTLMGFALGGKKTDNSISLTPGYEKKTTGRPGVSVGHLGYLHSLVMGSTVQETLWFNLFTTERIGQQLSWSSGLGVALWERMPEGEDCLTARQYKESYLGRLVPLCRFCLLSEEGLHYSEGIHFSGYKEGGIDPSVAINKNKNEKKAAWVDPEKRPWRMLSAFLSYLEEKKDTNSFECLFLQEGVARGVASCLPFFWIWSGGLRVSSNAGEQYVSGSDDFVESKTILSRDTIHTFKWAAIIQEIDFLEKLSKILYTSISSYYSELNKDGSEHARIATNLFWQMCDKRAQDLFQIENPKSLRNHFRHLIVNLYDNLCPQETARQIRSWAQYKPRIKIS